MFYYPIKFFLALTFHPINTHPWVAYFCWKPLSIKGWLVKLKPLLYRLLHFVVIISITTINTRHPYHLPLAALMKSHLYLVIGVNWVWVKFCLIECRTKLNWLLYMWSIGVWLLSEKLIGLSWFCAYRVFDNKSVRSFLFLAPKVFVLFPD